MSAPQSNLETLPRSIRVVLALGLVGLIAFPFVGSEFYQQMVARMMILAIFAMSLDLLQGVTGLVSLGHAAYFGLGGYALALQPAFHKVFLCAEGAYVEVDTQADPNHDATGVGRILFKGCPPGFPLGLPFASHSKCIYAPGCSAPETPVALGPAWRGPDGAADSLASWSEGVRVEIETLKTGCDVSGVACVYRKGATTVHETVRIVRGKVLLDWSVEIDGSPVLPVEIVVPCLVGDGESRASSAPADSGVDLEFRGRTVAFRWGADMRLQSDSVEIANRNGIYRLLRLVAPSQPAHIDISVASS